MNTTVYLAEPMDLGVGSKDRVTFVGCGWHVDEHGTLHIRQEGRGGNCAAFADGTWLSVLDPSRSVVAEERGA